MKIIKYGFSFIIICLIGTILIGGFGKNNFYIYDQNDGSLGIETCSANYNQEKEIATVFWSTNKVSDRFEGAKVSIDFYNSNGQKVYSSIDASIAHDSVDSYFACNTWKDKKNVKELLKQGDLTVEVNIIGIAYSTLINRLLSSLQFALAAPLILVFFIIAVMFYSGSGLAVMAQRVDREKAFDIAKFRFSEAVYNASQTTNPSYKAEYERSAAEAYSDMLKYK